MLCGTTVQNFLGVALIHSVTPKIVNVVLFLHMRGRTFRTLMDEDLVQIGGNSHVFTSSVEQDDELFVWDTKDRSKFEFLPARICLS